MKNANGNPYDVKSVNGQHHVRPKNDWGMPGREIKLLKWATLNQKVNRLG